MQPDATKIRKLLKKTQHHDKDERYMATSDLTSELEKVDGLLDSSLQTPIRDAILKQLDDVNNDVQAQAIRCLVAIVQKFNAEQVEEIVDKLGIRLVESSMEIRDIYCDALKKIIREAKEEYGQQISRKLVLRIMDGLRRQDSKSDSTKGNTEEEMQQAERNDLNRLIACLDILTDLLSRFGHIMPDAHQKIVNAVLPMLNNDKAEVRKKVAIVLGAMVGVLSNDEFQKLMDIVITRITKASNDDDKLFTYIQTIGVFSRNAGKRISEYLKQIVPLLIKICSDSKLDEDPSEAHKELRENCLQAFETLIVECPKEMSTHSKELKDVALELMKFDPNWDYPDSDDDNDMEDEKGKSGSNDENADVDMNGKQNNKSGGGDDGDDGDDDGFGDDGDDAFDDGDDWGDDGGAAADGGAGWGDDDGAVVVASDDDTSWKVRRAAVKMLAALIQTHKAHVQQYHLEICKALLKRFKEHDASVREAIFLTFRELLMASIVGGVRSLNANTNPFEAPPLVRQISAFELMSLELGSMVKHIVRVFKEKNVGLQTKKGLLGIIGDLVVVRQAERSDRCAPMTEEGLSKYFDSLIPQIVLCAKDKDVQLKIQSLAVLSLLLQKHRPQECIGVLTMVDKVVIECVQVDYARVKTQALLIISRMMEIMRPFINGDTSYDKNLCDKLVNELFEVALKQLELKDVEQDVKKAALDAASKSIAHFGDVLANKVGSTLDVFIQRLSNEVTRQTSLVCFGTIAKSPLNVDLSKCGNKLVSEMSSFLKQQSASLKLDTAETLKSVIHSCGKSIDSKLIEDLIIQCSEFINDSDLHLCHLILDLLCEIMESDPKSCKVIAKAVFPCCYRFLQSPLLQGSALISLKNLFVTFRKVSQGKVVSYEQMKSDLIKSAVPKLSRQSYGAISQCLASVTLECDDKTQDKAVAELIAVIQKSDNEAQIALLCIGEIGKKRDLSSHDDIEKKIFNGFSRESEPVRWAASHALGNMAVGNMKKYVPSLLSMIKTNNDRQYLLLNSLKVIITAHSDSEESMEQLVPYSDSIVPLMLSNASSKDEGVRAMIAECLGKFAVIDKRIFSEIEKLLGDKEATIRSTMAAAVKFGLSRKNNYSIPETTVKEFLKLLEDSDLAVKRQAFLTVNTILHVRSALIYHALVSMVPIIYKATIFDPNLVREVDLGPFKHREDDGLPLRKAAFQCLDTLLESVPHALDLFEFLKYLTNGITDESPDIQMLSYQILARLAHLHGTKVCGAFDELPGPLMSGIKAKLQEAKQNNQDAERAKDILRAAVKALYAMKSVPNVANRARGYVTFYGRVEKTKILIPMIADLKKTSKNIPY